MPSSRTVSRSPGSPTVASRSSTSSERSKTSPRAWASSSIPEASAAGSNQTTLPSLDTSAPQVVENIATMPSPRPTVASSRSSAVIERAFGGAGELSCTSTRGCAAVPPTRTTIGGSACRIALVTSSDTPSSAASARSSRPIVASSETTQTRARRTD